LSVNYGGSSGYGRDYIKRLEHEWGHVDADDTISAVKSISSDPYNYIDPERVCIRGGSSGGFTALCGLYRGSKKNTFAAANSSYGVSELLSLAATTHKFEMKYMLKLIGAKGTTSPEDIAIFKERSPVNHGDEILVPVLVS
jgi:dipeptidyl aminopeptidase/acylaminoacyl peptidase